MKNDKQPAASVDGNNGAGGEEKMSLGHHFADAVTAGLGSWKFIMGQTATLATWITLNTTDILPVRHWDPNLTLLNLTLSCEAAFAASLILMSQNRRADRDRTMVEQDYQVDIEAAQGIQDLNRKFDFLLAAMPPEQLEALKEAAAASAPSSPAAMKSNDNGKAVQPAVCLGSRTAR